MPGENETWRRSGKEIAMTSPSVTCSRSPDLGKSGLEIEVSRILAFYCRGSPPQFQMWDSEFMIRHFSSSFSLLPTRWLSSWNSTCYVQWIQFCDRSLEAYFTLLVWAQELQLRGIKKPSKFKMAAKSRAEAMKAVEAIFERYDDDFLVQSLRYSICSFPASLSSFELSSKIPLLVKTPHLWPPNL